MDGEGEQTGMLMDNLVSEEEKANDKGEPPNEQNLDLDPLPISVVTMPPQAVYPGYLYHDPEEISNADYPSLDTTDDDLDPTESTTITMTITNTVTGTVTASNETGGSSKGKSSSSSTTQSRTLSELVEFKKKIVDDERLSRMYRLRYNFSEQFDNRAYLHPHGCKNFDYKAIHEERQAPLEHFKYTVRQENYRYLGSHPEIRALISLFTKKLLVAQPPNPAEYLAEFFTSKIHDQRVFQEMLDDEMKKYSRYRINKMRKQGRISMRPSTTIHADSEIEELTIPENDVNFMKKLTIGPLAQDFYFDPNLVPKKKTVAPKEEKKKVKKKKPHVYCGCKDWKVKARQQLQENVIQKPAPPPEENVNTMSNIDFMTDEEEDQTVDQSIFGVEVEEDGAISEKAADEMANAIFQDLFNIAPRISSAMPPN